LGQKKLKAAINKRVAKIDSLNEGRILLTYHTARGNNPKPANNEKNIFSSRSRLVLLNNKYIGTINRNAIAMIVLRPVMPNSINPAIAMTDNAIIHCADF
jgi:hypothetical protein